MQCVSEGAAVVAAFDCSLMAFLQSSWSVLHWAALRGNTDVVFALVEAGASVSCETKVTLLSRCFAGRGDWMVASFPAPTSCGRTAGRPCT